MHLSDQQKTAEFRIGHTYTNLGKKINYQSKFGLVSNTYDDPELWILELEKGKFSCIATSFTTIISLWPPINYLN